MTKNIKIAIGVTFALLIGIWAANYLLVQRHVRSALASDIRNEGIEVSAHLKAYSIPNVLVYDLKSVDGNKSTLDVMRVLFQFAEQIKQSNFNEVELQCRGTVKFKLAGSYFKQIGEEFSFQNPVYTLRTFPENLTKPDGSPAFGTWSGGMLGVVSEQMGDLNEFGRQWIQDCVK